MNDFTKSGEGLVDLGPLLDETVEGGGGGEGGERGAEGDRKWRE